jgi:hypothetical protein
VLRYLRVDHPHESAATSASLDTSGMPRPSVPGCSYFSRGETGLEPGTPRCSEVCSGGSSNVLPGLGLRLGLRANSCAYPLTEGQLQWRRSGRLAGSSFDGETRTRTGDTTIFSRAVYSLERRRNPWKTMGSSTTSATGNSPQFAVSCWAFGRWLASRLPLADTGRRCVDPASCDPLARR